MKKANNRNQPCPNKSCDRHGLKNQGNIISIGTYMTKSGKRRIFKCGECGETFSETRDTVFYDLRTPEDKVMTALKMIPVRVSLSGISFVLGVTEETVLMWPGRAYEKAGEINSALLTELPVTEVQPDEMQSFVRRTISENSEDGTETPSESEDGRWWIWISYAPEFRLILAMAAGPRTLETAMILIQMTANVVLGVPCFFSDGFSCHFSALIEYYHRIKVFPRTGKPGRPEKSVMKPHENLIYGQVVKEREKGRVVGTVHRVICGAERPARPGLEISTSLIERLNRTIRQSLAPPVRKTLSFSKERKNLEKQVIFFQAFYNFARPHMSLREKVSESGGLFRRKWKQVTPGMAAGITDHVWTFRELLSFKPDRSP